MNITQADRERFWKYVTKTAGCWYWTGGKGGPKPYQYGYFNTPSFHWRAHRFSYTVIHGPISPGLNICHICDNNLCVRPDHLFPGTQKDNMQDKARKGRAPSGPDHPLARHPERRARGEQHGNAQFSTADIQTIRLLCDLNIMKQYEIAALYRTSQGVISKIANRVAWAHVP